MDMTESAECNCSGTSICDFHVDDHGWTRVVSRRRKLNQKQADGGASGNIVPTRPHNSFGDENAASNENPKAKKTQKKPLVSLAEAAAKIDNRYLDAFLFLSMKSAQPHKQLLRFAEFLAEELSEVEFPWLEVFPLKGPWPKLIDVIDVPLSDIPEPVYKTLSDWLHQLPLVLLSGYVVFAFRSTLTHLAALREAATVYGKLREQLASLNPQIGEQLPSSIPRLVIFVTLAMTLRTQPNALARALGNLRDEPSLQREDALPLTVWMMAQALQGGSVSVSMHSWAMNMLPVVRNKNCNPRSRDLILQLVEKILSAPYARDKLMKRARGKGKRVIPPPSFEILLRLTFPPSSERVKATERFEAIYPFLKEVALAGSPGSEEMKEAIQETFIISLKLAGEVTVNPTLAKEATEIAVWCVTENVDCCKQWDRLYEENLEASVAVLKKLVDEWKDRFPKLSSSPENNLTLRQVVKSFRLQNEKAIAENVKAIAKSSKSKAKSFLRKEADKSCNNFLHKEADKSCKVLLGRLFRGSCKYYCLKATTTYARALARAGLFVAWGLACFAASVLLSNAIFGDLHTLKKHHLREVVGLRV